jgi:SAM-dependent methyltransferase
MQHPPVLTDRTALARQRKRAQASASPAAFLQEVAASELLERLSLVNRSFTAPAIVTPWPDIWAGRLESARIVHDDEVLDLTPGAHDLVIHSMGLHWANDPVGQLIQVRRALKPDGLFLGATFGGQTLAELRAVLAEAETAVTGGLSPRVLPMAEIRDLGGLLQRAGFALPVADSLTQTVTYSDILHLMRDLRAMGETNAMTARSHSFTRREMLAQATERYSDSFSDNGRIRATFDIIVLTGWSPDESQPKPARPGSATTRLADVLGVDETPLGGPELPHRN